MEVKEISDIEFEHTIANHDKVIIKFYADWCGSCRLFHPKYKRLAKDGRFGNITFLNVDAETNALARKAAGVTNLPFFAIYQNGTLRDTTSGSKEEAIVELLSKLN